MRVDLFDFTLPPELIALRPAAPRDSARLLKVERGEISDHKVGDLPRLLGPRDILVFNDTKVIPAQLEGMTITHLSDLHFTGSIEREYFELVVEQANAHVADLVVVVRVQQ